MAKKELDEKIDTRNGEWKEKKIQANNDKLGLNKICRERRMDEKVEERKGIR